MGEARCLFGAAGLIGRIFLKDKKQAPSGCLGNSPAAPAPAFPICACAASGDSAMVPPVLPGQQQCHYSWLPWWSAPKTACDPSGAPLPHCPHPTLAASTATEASLGPHRCLVTALQLQYWWLSTHGQSVSVRTCLTMPSQPLQQEQQMLHTHTRSPVDNAHPSP